MKRKNFFEKKILQTTSAHWAKDLRPFVELWPAGCCNCILSVHRMFFMIIELFWKKIVFQSLSDTERKNSSFLERISSAVLFKLHFKCLWELFKEFSFEKTSSSNHFRTLSRKIFTFCRVLSGGFVKTAFCKSEGVLSWRFFWPKLYYSSHFPSKTFLQGYQFCILSVNGNLFRNFFFEHWTENFRRCGKKESTTANYASKKTLLGKTILSKIFPIIFEYWAKKSRHSDEKFSAGLSKLHSACPRGPLE